MTPIEQVQAVLDELAPLTRHQIARRLRREGIVGEVLRPATCPLAVYLVRQTGVPVTVTHLYAWLVLEPRVCSLPLSVSEFVQAVDAGRHPSLVS